MAHREVPAWAKTSGVVVGLVALLAALGITFYTIAQSLGPRLGVSGSGLFTIAQFLVALVTLGPILWAVFRYRSLADDQRKAKHYQAWQAISDAQGKPGSGGRRTALEDLHKDGDERIYREPTCGTRTSGEPTWWARTSWKPSWLGLTSRALP